MIIYGYGSDDWTVELGPVESGDLRMMRDWRNDPAIWRWCRQNDLISDIMQARWFESQDKDPTIHMYMILGRETAHPRGLIRMGVCGLTSHDKNNRTAELSLYIGPEFQKKGLSKPTFKTLMRHGFENLNLHSIWCECFSGNPVIGVVKGVGFKPDGVKREAYFKDGKYVDAELFSILEKEWKA